MRHALFIAIVTAAAACGGDDGMMATSSTLQNVTATALSGRSISNSNRLWACMTWEPAGIQKSTSFKASIGCGVILPGAPATTK